MIKTNSASSMLLSNMEVEYADQNSIIRQEYSWGRFLISQTSLQSLISHHNIFSRFYDLISAFGFKTSEDDRIWDGFHSVHNMSQAREEKDTQSGEPSNTSIGKRFNRVNHSLELCYSIRYMDKNGRDPRKPWSLRQVGVYQQTRNLEKQSVWILIQPPERLHQQLKSAISGTSSHEWSKQDRDMMLHLAVLSVTLSNWDQYIEYLRNELTQLVSLNHFKCRMESDTFGIGG